MAPAHSGAKDETGCWSVDPLAETSDGWSDEVKLCSVNLKLVLFTLKYQQQLFEIPPIRSQETKTKYWRTSFYSMYNFYELVISVSGLKIVHGFETGLV